MKCLVLIRCTWLPKDVFLVLLPSASMLFLQLLQKEPRGRRFQAPNEPLHLEAQAARSPSEGTLTNKRHRQTVTAAVLSLLRCSLAQAMQLLKETRGRPGKFDSHQLIKALCLPNPCVPVLYCNITGTCGG